MAARTSSRRTSSKARKRIQNAAMRLFAERGTMQLTVSELADAAGVARGTIYNQNTDVAVLFEQVATSLTHEMSARIQATLASTDDPLKRLALGIRLFVRRAHAEPIWGRFIVRFGVTTPTLRGLLSGRPARDLERAVKDGRLQLRSDQFISVIAMMSGGVFAAIMLVLEGYQTWREAGSSAAELFLRAIGVQHDEALALSRIEVPELVPDEPE
jgi:AcrR family transcriptional regulator